MKSSNCDKIIKHVAHMMLFEHTVFFFLILGKLITIRRVIHSSYWGTRLHPADLLAVIFIKRRSRWVPFLELGRSGWVTFGGGS